ncbi:MAG TPA: hypothetical protein VG937_31335 [Polyangiaceae bacterium]|nr:hypothetical protein [Polyangiaceae bacterium]
MLSLNRVVRSTAAPVFVTAWLLGCSHDKQPETGGYQQGQVQYGQQTAGQGGQAVGGQAPVAPPGYGQVPPAPGTTAGASVGGASTVGGAPALPPTAAGATARGGGAQVVDPAAATVVQPVLNQLAKSFTVAGAKPVGSPLVGNFQTGQTLEGQVQLQPQKCYTIVATALAPVTELNLQLVATTPLPNLTPVLATDSETGPTAVIGKKPNCYRWPFPLPAPAKLVLQVAGGSGLAAVQVYEK